MNIELELELAMENSASFEELLAIAGVSEEEFSELEEVN